MTPRDAPWPVAQAWEIAEGDWILAPDAAGKMTPAKVTLAQPSLDGYGARMRIFAYVTEGGEEHQIEPVSVRQMVQRVPGPELTESSKP